MKKFFKGASLLLAGAAAGVLGKTAYDSKGSEIKKVAKDITKNVKTKISSAKKKKVEPKKEK